MAPRAAVQLDKAAWNWVNDVTPEDVGEEHVELAYRVNTAACRRGVCRKNCRGNPNCLVGIGEQLWLGEIDDYIGDPNWERRDKNAFVGLTNLGATCYVNAFLQVWFHNLELRRSLYRCHSARAQEHNDDAGSVYEPQSISEHLQYLFALLQNSSRRYIDPSGLVKALGLDTGLQQDAQEFSKLFLTLLEDSLAKQTDPGLQKVIQNQFCGEFSYVTVCNRCGRVSPLPSTFYELELNIQGLKNLGECVSEFLREEKLDGDNRYFCESCQGKQNAARRIKLHSLPPILNLQLMRFVFDRQTGHKKKLNSYITFPELLDMGPYLEGKEDRKCLYELSTVLIHRGVTAYSGHYIAHVKDARTGEWYNFNDEEIEKMEGKALHLGVEEDLTSQHTRKPRCNKGHHSSRNAYMLVYKVQEEQNITDPSSRTDAVVPAFLQRLVDRDNHEFEEQCVKMADKRKQNMDKWKEVKEIYDHLPAVEGQPYEFVPVDWLKAWLDESAKTTEIDNSLLLCSHRKLHPNKVCEAKRVSLQAARVLYDRYGGGPRLNASSLCEECVVECCRVQRLKNQLQEDYQEVARLVKGTPSCGEGFWVGKQSLKGWRLLALKQLEEEDEQEMNCPNNANGKEYGPHLPEGNNNYEEEMRTSFNEDILCGHGTLSTLTTERRLVPPDVWSTLRAYFPRAPEFGQRQQACSQCFRLEHEEKLTATMQKNQLINLFKEKNRPKLSGWTRGGTDVLYVIPLCFVDEWRKFIRKPTKSPPVSSVDNVPLLCPHGGFMFTYEALVNGDAQNIALLWPNEWEAVNRLFAVDQTISIHRSRRGATTPPQYSTRPELCHECREGFLVQRQRDQREYAQATVYVHKVKMTRQEEEEEAASSEPNAAEQNGSGSDAEEERDPSPKRDGSPKMDDDSPEKLETEDVDLDMVKRLKLNNGATSVAPTGPAPYVSANNNNNNNNNNNAAKTPRRSMRNRKKPEEKKLTISASQTLRELKIQIMSAFSVATFDQNLTIKGRRLTDDLATLGSLGVTPNSTIVLTADEPVADYAAMDDVYQVGMPEEGFKGTGLLGY